MASLAAFCLALRPDATHSPAQSQLHTLPRRVLWAWERPEDLRGIDPRTTGVAYLDQTILLGREVTNRPRLQPLAYPSGTARVAVVRVEVVRGALLDRTQQEKATELLLASARRPGIAALQVDFDATRSQRGFYADVLRELHRRMPPGLPLSMTALASWCGNDDWISDLPIDEAVPMFFRMEPDRRRTPRNADELRMREPLCVQSVGVSTREPWPEDLAGKRVYVFADRGWREDLSLLGERGLP